MHTITAPAELTDQSADQVPLFDTGRVNLTWNAARALQRCGLNPKHVLARHAAGDWMEMSIDEAVANTEAIATGSPVRSAYDTGGGVHLYVVTDQQRRVTTVLLASEYKGIPAKLVSCVPIACHGSDVATVLSALDHLGKGFPQDDLAVDYIAAATRLVGEVRRIGHDGGVEWDHFSDAISSNADCPPTDCMEFDSAHICQVLYALGEFLNRESVTDGWEPYAVNLVQQLRSAGFDDAGAWDGFATRKDEEDSRRWIRMCGGRP